MPTGRQPITLADGRGGRASPSALRLTRLALAFSATAAVVAMLAGVLLFIAEAPGTVRAPAGLLTWTAALSALAGAVFAFCARKGEPAGHGLAAADAPPSGRLAELREPLSLPDPKILVQAVETMHVGLTIADEAGRILYVNRADAEMHGYSPDELIGQQVSVYATGKTQERADDPSTYGLWERDRINVDRRGRTFPVRLTSDVVRDERGSAVATITLCENITERRAAEEAVMRRGNILEAVSFAAERLLHETDWDRDLAKVLSRFAQATGARRVEKVRSPELARKAEAVHVASSWPDGPALTRSEMNLLLGLLPDRVDSTAIVRAPVAALPVELTEPWRRAGVVELILVPIVVAGSRWGLVAFGAGDDRRLQTPAEQSALLTSARMLGSAIGRKQTQTALKESEAAYRALVQAASDMVLSVDLEGTIRFRNQSAVEALGLSSLDRAPRLEELVALRHRERWRQAFQKAIDTGGATSELILLSGEGEEVPVEARLDLRQETERAGEVLAIFREVRERHAIDALREEFVSVVNHELRTPITSMLGALGLLHDGGLFDRPDRTEELLEIACRNGDRLLLLIDGLLDLQKMSAGLLQFDCAPTPLGALLEEAVATMQGLAEASEVRLDLELPPEGSLVFADRDRLLHVLYNLISNAVKFSPVGETVEIRTDRSEHGHSITVRDHGPGIPPDFRDRLFDPFAQAPHSAEQRRRGSGLGMTIAKRFVEGLGGTIEVQLCADRGTAVTVGLPDAQGP